MKKIFKYAFNGIVELPKGAEIISAQEQHGKIQIWAIVDPSAETEKRLFALYGTGHEMDDRSQKFIATIQRGEFVWHLFEVFI